MIVIIIGTRAELIKMFPLMHEFQNKKKKYIFIHTGQHNLGYFPKLFDVKDPDFVLTNPPEKSHTKFFSKVFKAIVWNILIVPRIWLVLRKIKHKKYVIYHGDTMTTMSAAIASSVFLNPFKKYKNVHLEAGLRSGSLLEPFPEEISRQFCDAFSDMLIAVSDLTQNNLKKSLFTRNKKIYLTGNTVVDSTLYAVKLAGRKYKKEGFFKERGIEKNKYALITIHRFENIKFKNRLEKIIDILLSIPKEIKIVFIMYDNTKKQLADFGLLERIENNFVVMSELEYLEFTYLISNSKFIITDGGGVQEESLILKKPCILMRKRTERIEGLETGINFLTELKEEKLKKAIKLVLDRGVNTDIMNPYGVVGVSKKIEKLLT